MKVLGLDLSLKATGVCILEGGPDRRPESFRTKLFSQPTVKGVEARVRRLVAIAEGVVGLVEEELPDHIIIEAPAKSQQWQAAYIGELHGVIKVQIFLATGQIPMVKEANEMRKVVVGKIAKTLEVVKDGKGKEKRRWSYGTKPGKRGKPVKATVKDVIERILRERGLEFPTQDEMDAYVAAEYCWRKLVAPTGYIADEEEETQNASAQPSAH